MIDVLEFLKEHSRAIECLVKTNGPPKFERYKDNLTEEKKEEIPKVLLPTGKPHISHSELRGWVECSWRHKLQHVDKIDLQVPNTNLCFGTATHAVVEHWLNTKTIDLTVASKIFDEEFEKHKDVEDFQKNSKEKFLKVIGNIMAELPAFLDETFPGWELVKAEEALYEDLAVFYEKHAGLAFKGYVDIVLKVPGKKEGTFLYWILDLKTANRPWNADKIKDENNRRQLIFYKKFWATKHNVEMSEIRCGFLTAVKTAKPGKFCALIPISVGDVTVGRALTILNNGLSSIKRGVAIKNRNSCKYCEFKGTPFCT